MEWIFVCTREQLAVRNALSTDDIDFTLQNNMGIEYRFHISARDRDNLARTVDSVDSLDSLLRAAPHFMSGSEQSYSYTEDPGNEKRWPSTIVVRDGGMDLCVYSRSGADLELKEYLMRELLDRCGRLEVEDG